MTFHKPAIAGRFRIRAMTRNDATTIDTVFAGLSATSRYLRFHGPMPRLNPSVRAGLLDLDGTRRLALVAEVTVHDRWRPIGIARLAATGEYQAELAVAVADVWQRRGVGRRLLEELGQRAAELGFRELYGDVLPHNRVIVRLLQQVFPGAIPRWTDGVVRVHCPVGVPEVAHDDVLAALVGYRGVPGHRPATDPDPVSAG